MDLFENTVLCKNCGKKMKPAFVEKEGFRIRALKCPSCSNQILHPSDVDEYNKFNSLRNRQFQVKLRLVGNSYTVSIPREIVNFMREEEEEESNPRQNIHQTMQEHMKRQMHAMEQMVTLAMEEANKIGLSFNIRDESLNNPRIDNNTKKTETVFRVLRNHQISDINHQNEPKKIKSIKIIKIRRAQ